MGISKKLVMFVGSAVLLSFAATTTAVVTYVRHVERANITQVLASQNHEHAATIALGFSDAIAVAQSMRDMFELAANNPDARINRKMLTDSIDAMLDMYPGILGVWYNFEPNAIGNDWRYIEKDNPTGGFNYYIGYTGENGAKEYVVTSYDANYQEEYYIVPTTTGKMLVTNPYVDDPDGAPADATIAGALVSSIAFPVLRNNQPVGVVGVDISAASLGKMLEPINSKSNMHAALIAPDGTIVAHKYPELVGKKIFTELSEAKKDPANKKLSRAMINELVVSPEILASVKDAVPHSESAFSSGMDTGVVVHKSTITLGSGVNQRHWALISAVSENTAYATANKILLCFMAANILAFILIVCCVYAVGRTAVAAPINEASRKILAAAKGDLTQRLEIRSSDEFGKLYESFNCLVRNTQVLLEAIKDKSIALARATGNVSQHGGSVSHNIGSTDGVISRTASGITTTIAPGIASTIEKVKVSANTNSRRIVGIDAGYEDAEATGTDVDNSTLTKTNTDPAKYSDAPQPVASPQLLAQQLKILTDKFTTM